MTNIVKFKARGPRAYLREAQEQSIPVRVKRDGIDPGWVHGMIADVSAEFVLISEISDSMRFDGFLVIALGDVSHAEEDPSREFVEKALALNGETLKAPPNFPLENWATVARAASDLAPVISVNMLDEESGEASYIGKLENLGPEVLSLREIDPNARWYPDAGDYEYGDIGSIGFGTSYMQTLYRVAGEPSGPPQEPRLHSTDPR
ncbi:hypothetical protein DFR29_111217 [Tahibacter aquaticus]|uniref:Uncharacterized protein n=1 Tax=Tahibacter aquaticus TaxID=520092 RepID=A0A4R6YSW8_9GAMM|nr:hypothetical protein [Tahibacter aquaticus]TDR41303.1 hypothetical protein DFR29_111217 [Tahibacter aquaticus]